MNLEQILTALMIEIDNLVETKVNQKLSELKNGYTKKVKPLMTVQEAADYLNLSPKTIYRYAQTGKLNFYKPGQKKNSDGIEAARNTKIMFKQDELDAFLLDDNFHYLSNYELEKEADTRIALSKI